MFSHWYLLFLHRQRHCLRLPSVLVKIRQLGNRAGTQLHMVFMLKVSHFFSVFLLIFFFFFCEQMEPPEEKPGSVQRLLYIECQELWNLCTSWEISWRGAGKDYKNWNRFNTAYSRMLFSFQSVWSQEVPIGCDGLCSPFLDVESVGWTVIKMWYTASNIIHAFTGGILLTKWTVSVWNISQGRKQEGPKIDTNIVQV